MNLDERVMTRLKIDPQLTKGGMGERLGLKILGVVEKDRPVNEDRNNPHFTWVEKRGNHFRWVIDENLRVYSWRPEKSHYSNGYNRGDWKPATRRMSLIIKAVYIGAVLAGEVEPFHVA